MRFFEINNVRISLPLAVLLISFVLLGALVPGFVILWIANGMYPEHVNSLATIDDLLYIPQYFMKAFVSIFAGWISLMMYADLVLPAINTAFEHIFSLMRMEEKEKEAIMSAKLEGERKEDIVIYQTVTDDLVSGEKPECQVKSPRLSSEERNDSGIGLDEY